MKIFFLVLLLSSSNIFSVICKEDDIDLNPGDVISAEMLKDVLLKISGRTSKISPNELNGKWNCKSINQNRTAPLRNGYSLEPDGIGSSMSQEVTFIKQTDESFVITYNNNLGQSGMETPTPNVCHGKFIDNDFLMVDKTDGETSCWNTGVAAMTMTGNQCFKWEVQNGVNSGVIYCDKINKHPLPPINLEASINSTEVALTWAAGDEITTSYQIKVKTSLGESFVDIVTGAEGTNAITEISDTNYTDSLSSGKKWYRVYAINENGISIGSNVVSVSYSDQ